MNNPNNPPGDFSSGYGSVNRSPSSARQPFPNTISMPSVRRQPPHNQPSLDFAQPPYDERYNAFDSRFDQRPAPSPASMAFPSGVLGNNQAWNYNGGAMTLNDARMGKMRPRAPLHAEWTHPNEDQAHYPQANFQAYDGFYGERHYSERREPSSNDLIPTAIVIKNIPFNVRKEHLTQTMVDMNLPQPYAFNYHFDKGVFRGLAFANFQSAEDTALVIKAMDGFEIQNRKLRVEYKKMLPEHERERIEREKREKRGQLEEQHRPLATQVSMSSLSTSSQAPQRAAEGASSRFSSVTIPSSDYPTSRASGSATPLSAQPQLTAPALSINLNDPVVLKYYIALHNFKESDKENLAFDQNLPPEDRRLVHVIAHHMGLEHTSYGTGDGRFVNVGKKKLSPAAPQLPTHLQTGAGLDSHPRGLSRAATFDHSESRTQQMSLLSANHRVGLNLHVPGSPEYQAGGLNSLRNIKSFADLRSYSPSPSPSTVSANNNLLNPPAGYLGHYGSDHPFGPSLAPTTPGGAPTGTLPDQPSLIPGFGSLSIGTSAFDSGSSMGRTRETPGAIGSSRPGANGSQRAKPNRQPAGPGDLGNVGFDRRTNGHMQRNSDSSDTTGRLPGASGASHF